MSKKYLADMIKTIKVQRSAYTRAKGFTNFEVVATEGNFSTFAKGHIKHLEKTLSIL